MVLNNESPQEKPNHKRTTTTVKTKPKMKKLIRINMESTIQQMRKARQKNQHQQKKLVFGLIWIILI